MRSFLAIAALVSCSTATMAAERPNVVLLMCDDLGYGDTGFNGHEIIQTPHLDSLARQGAVLTNFHSGDAVCSPTRGTCLTGRLPYRYGIWFANAGHLPAQEYTIPRMLKEQRYTTGHFGKWHLGTLSREFSSKGPKRNPAANYSPPWERGYDQSFVTESAVATWNPVEHARYKNNYYFENGEQATENLDGDDSRIIMDRAIPFVEQAVRQEEKFLAVIWFHAPHVPVIAGPEYLAKYEGHGEAAHYYGCITAVDDQVGRLTAKLKSLGVFEDTLIFFCSDNGPEGRKPQGRNAGTTDGLRGRKRSQYEGGVRVPAFACWPGHIPAESRIDVPLSTLDYLPTLASILDVELPDRPIDGDDVSEILAGRSQTREPIPFRVANTASVIAGDFKLVLRDFSSHAELYNLRRDRAEEHNIVTQYPEKVEELTEVLKQLEKSTKGSHAGKDYEDEFSPVDSWRPLEKESNKKQK
ncbi:sulfatase [Rubinisphaera sp. JC750]|uniref:sulfatase family protein n=1 Tax=Rubinisphaera sp. JC750 TaxID=2898658 RepID=UPI001F030BA1|nr:sulfatase-like hydrolase/transferase [Rubinisphaera sp. JC750]